MTVPAELRRLHRADHHDVELAAPGRHAGCDDLTQGALVEDRVVDVDVALCCEERWREMRQILHVRRVGDRDVDRAAGVRPRSRVPTALAAGQDRSADREQDCDHTEAHRACHGSPPPGCSGRSLTAQAARSPGGGNQRKNAALVLTAQPRHRRAGLPQHQVRSDRRSSDCSGAASTTSSTSSSTSRCPAPAAAAGPADTTAVRSSAPRPRGPTVTPWRPSPPAHRPPRPGAGLNHQRSWAIRDRTPVGPVVPVRGRQSGGRRVGAAGFEPATARV